MATGPERHEVQLGPQGQLVIPAALRRALRLEAGELLVVRQDGDDLILERRDMLQKRLQDRFRHIPRNVNLVDELLAERRAEVARDGLDLEVDIRLIR
jgi:AbrB family looped-hinge helix DNA binding protein